MTCQYQAEVGIITQNDLSVTFHLKSPNDWCAGHISAITRLLIDSACASSWGAQGPTERKQWRMKEGNSGEAREWWWGTKVVQITSQLAWKARAS